MQPLGPGANTCTHLITTVVFFSSLVYLFVCVCFFSRRMELKEARKLVEQKKREKNEEKIARFVMLNYYIMNHSD